MHRKTKAAFNALKKHLDKRKDKTGLELHQKLWERLWAELEVLYFTEDDLGDLFDDNGDTYTTLLRAGVSEDDLYLLICAQAEKVNRAPREAPCRDLIAMLSDRIASEHQKEAAAATAEADSPNILD
jgi:hypothetical protein